VVAFIFATGTQAEWVTARVRRGWKIWLVIMALLAAGLVLLAYELREVKKTGQPHAT